MKNTPHPTQKKAQKKLLFATKNRGKVKELKALLKDLPIEILCVEDLSSFTSVEETGETFEANAELKARASAQQTGLAVLADDSGLEVDALKGQPGVKSARYSGPGATDKKNTTLLLKNLQKTPWPQRTARFRCVAAFFDPQKNSAPTLHLSHGKCEGYILEGPKGTSGFGYDPVFYFPPLAQTFAEIPADKKNKVSHRAHAMRDMAAFLSDYFTAQ